MCKSVGTASSSPSLLLFHSHHKGFKAPSDSPSYEGEFTVRNEADGIKKEVWMASGCIV